MLKWLYKLWYRKNPICIHCDSAMKNHPNKHLYTQLSWICVSALCMWETFEDTKGNLHWYR